MAVLTRGGFAAVALGLIGLSSGAAAASTASPIMGPRDPAFVDTFRELVETDSSITTGSCTAVADKVEARLRAAGYGDGDITRFAVPDHPKEGGIVVVLRGASPARRPILLLGHIDVVTARREDWVRDPYKMIEEGGYFYARGASDMKSIDAAWIDTMARLRREKTPPRATVKMALTCGEETSGAFNGAQWLSNNRRELIDAAFALNEGGGGLTDGKGLSEGGRLVVQELQVGEKAYQDFTLTATNPGGHSSQPIPENAIVSLARALERVHAYRFPVQFNDTTRAYFSRSGALRGDETGRAMVALAANPADTAAEAVVNRDKMLHSLLRTTCVPTLVEAGHALNALPQRATANVNCRMFPGNTAEQTRAALVAAIDDPSVSIEGRVKDKPIAKAPPMDPQVIKPIETLAAKYFPGVPVVPSMSTGASDAVYTGAVGIPTYGVPGIWSNPDGNGIHGLNERIEIQSLLTGRAYLYDLVKTYVY
jgi:acetylornithine deacetylase/succinyl-diaminopimelate desuccinylase-like protein